MRTKIARLALGAVALLLLGEPHEAAAQFEFSHLQCGKFRGHKIPRGTYTADEFFFGNCVIKVPPKQICSLTFKTNVNPPPPGGGPNTDLLGAGAPLNFVCYKQKCPKRLSNALTFKDQFGTHTLPANTTVSTNLLCAPSSLSGAFLDDPSVF
jgi:hypothetical protein